MARAKRRPSICLDEHLHPRVAEAFKGTFRTIEVSRTNRFKGRDELQYISELYRENAIFVTSDGVFIGEVVENGLRHAGLIFVPQQMTLDEKVLFAEIVCGFVRGGCTASPFAFRGRILHPAHDGLRTIFSKRDELEFSWDWLSQMLGTNQ